VGQRDTRPSGAFEVLAAAAAAAGTALHAAPARAVEALARRWTPQPQRVAFGRIVFGLVVLPLWYAGLVALAAAIGGGAWFTAPAVAPVLGALACRRIDRRRAAARASLPGETP
jgi:hypothetical protein